MSTTHHPLLSVVFATLPEQGSHRCGTVTPGEMEMENDEQFAFTAPIELDVHISPLKKDLLVRGRLQTQVDTRCDRCLETFPLPVQVDDVCHLIENADEDVVSLTPHLRDDILLALPARTVCSETCRGLCPQCGQNLNQRTCECARDTGRGGPWSQLDTLDLDADA